MEATGNTSRGPIGEPLPLGPPDWCLQRAPNENRQLGGPGGGSPPGAAARWPRTLRQKLQH
eukprot:763383-Alexandrium_andersonii.AAC.1